MWFFIFFVCIFVAICSDEIREGIGWFPWIQWIIVGGMFLYMVLSWIF